MFYSSIDAAHSEFQNNDYLDINTDIAPPNLWIKTAYNTDVNITLPAAITGFNGMYYYADYEGALYSNFEVTTQQNSSQSKSFKYGAGNTDIQLESYGGTVRILKGM